MTEQNGSKKWMMAVRVIMILLGIIQAGLIGWAKYITNEVIVNRSETVSAKEKITNIQNDVTYIRNRLDSLYELRRR